MKRILIVEDDPFTSEVYRMGLEWSGFAVSTAANLAEATRLLSPCPDAVLLDLILGEESGLDLLRSIRADRTTREVPVVMLSNAFMPDRVREAWEAGATECLDKAHASPPRVAARLQSAIDLVQRFPRQEAPPLVAAETAAAAAGATTHRESELHRTLVNTLRSRVETATLQFNGWVARNHRVTSDEFEDLLRSIHQVATIAGMAGLASICQLGSVLEALLAEIHVAPSKLTWSAVRTINQAVELLPRLLEGEALPHPGMSWTPLVLTVDDEPVAREFLTTALESAHLNTLNVGDPELALRMCEQNHFDLAFLDVDMPHMNGFELCQRLHKTETNPTTPVVFVSSMRDEQTRQKFSESGALDFINKPVMLSEVSVKALVHLHRTHLARAS